MGYTHPAVFPAILAQDGWNMPTTERGMTLRFMGRQSSAHHSESQTNRLAFTWFFNLLEALSAWCRAREDRVKDVYIEHAPDGLALYVIGEKSTFDFDLNEELATFTIELVDKGFPIHATLVPSSAPVHAQGFKDGHVVVHLNLR
jgi:hypothetical protein